jgi:hypothetical protein
LPLVLSFNQPYEFNVVLDIFVHEINQMVMENYRIITIIKVTEEIFAGNRFLAFCHLASFCFNLMNSLEIRNPEAGVCFLAHFDQV